MRMNKNLISDTICAPATVQGTSAVSIIRVSGPDSIKVADKVFRPAKGISLLETIGNKIRFGTIISENDVLDEVLVSVFRAPHSFTGEDSVEIACHGSVFIQQEIIKLLIENGIRFAYPGEFTERAFLNGKMDLAQAEAVADLIMAGTAASHRIALQQLRGGFSSELRHMRNDLLEIVSLMELELDFSDEDVEFADRSHLTELVNNIIAHLSKLIDSFSLGNAIKNGVPVAIAGATNTGKSTLLNELLGEERAIVSDIHGTTRDFIEDTVNIDGILFRFIDTAGIRKTEEQIEKLGIERTFDKIKSASIVLLVFDINNTDKLKIELSDIIKKIDKKSQKPIILLNKIDILKQYSRYNDQLSNIKDEIKKILDSTTPEELSDSIPILEIAAGKGCGIENLKKFLRESQSLDADSNSTLVANSRHYEALIRARSSLENVLTGLSHSLSTDLLTQDIREAMFHIGEITGEINTEEILGNIFSKFCIGK